MERPTYMYGEKWRLRIGDTEYSGKAVDRMGILPPYCEMCGARLEGENEMDCGRQGRV